MYTFSIWTEFLREEYDTKSAALKRQLKKWKSADRIWQFIERCHKELFFDIKEFEAWDEDSPSSVG